MIAAYGSSAFLEECRQMNEKEVKAGTSKKYEYVMLPFLGEKKTKNWTLTLPAGYVGLNSALKKEGNEEKMDACLKVMDIISTQKGQEALMKDLRLDNSYLKQFDRSDSKARIRLLCKISGESGGVSGIAGNTISEWTKKCKRCFGGCG